MKRSIVECIIPSDRTESYRQRLQGDPHFKVSETDITCTSDGVSGNVAVRVSVPPALVSMLRGWNAGFLKRTRRT